MTKPRRQPDICVIGGGSGGLSLAAGAASFGVNVELIERGKMGGDCLNTGCVPSKALLAAAKRAHTLKAGTTMGVESRGGVTHFPSVHDHVHGVIAAIAPHDSVERFTGLGVTVTQGTGTFTDANTLTVAGAEIQARRFVIASGSRPRVPPIPGLTSGPFLTNESIFDLSALPESLLVIGAGPIGLEMAQAFHRLGSKVTVVEPFQPLAKDDPELAQIALTALADDGLTILQGWAVEAVAYPSDSVEVSLRRDAEKQTLTASQILVATGREANIDALGLAQAGIAHTGAGITVDARQRTSNRRVYAIGDAAAGLQFTHVAGHQAGVVLRQILFRIPARFDPEIVPWCTYTDPELGWVGLTEDAAMDRFGAKAGVHRWRYTDNDRAQAERHENGMVKLVTGPGGRIVGGGAVGANTGEILNLISLCVARKLKTREVAGYISPYPTHAEVVRRAAVSQLAPGAKNIWVRRLISLLRTFG